MPIYRNRAGEVIEVPEGTRPEVLRKLGVARTETRYTGEQTPDGLNIHPIDEPSPERDEAKRRADTMEKKGVGRGAGSSLARGFMQNFDDELSGAVNAATVGVGKAIAHGDLGEIGKEYRIAKETQEELARRYSNQHPIMSTVAEVAGSLANPIGTTGKTAQLVGKSVKPATKLVKAGQTFVKAHPVAGAAAAGAKISALNAAGISDAKDWDETLPGAGVAGLVTGGAMGGAMALGTKAVDTIRRALPSNAKNVALERIAELIDGGKMTPAQAEAELLRIKRNGGDPMLADLTPSLQGEAMAVSRRTDVGGSNDMIERAEGRLAARPGRFVQKALDTAEVPANRAGGDAFAEREAIKGIRQATGTSDYAPGGVMDKPTRWSPELDKFFREAPPETEKILRQAYDDMVNRREDPAITSGLERWLKSRGTGVIPVPGTTSGKFDDLPGLPGGGRTVNKPDMPGSQGAFVQFESTSGLKPGKPGIGSFNAVPNFRVLDYLKRRFDANIGAAIKANDAPRAQMYSKELGALKQLMMDANPEYAPILATQRDLFQQEKAVEYGQEFWKAINREPRQYIKKVKAMEPDDYNNWRIGALDVLANMDMKANPVGQFLNATRNPKQRELLAMVMGGEDKLASFIKYLKRENNAQVTDNSIARGRQSITSRVQMASGANDPDGGAGMTIWGFLKGWAFGGAPGAFANTATTVRNIYSGTPLNKASQEEIAKLLLSDGKGLRDNISAASKVYSRRKARRDRAIINAGKAAGYNTGDSMMGGS